jgi:uncharacterized protein
MTAGLGIERLGLVSLRHPWLSLLVVAIITPIMAYAASRLEFSSDIREIFSSAELEFQLLDTIDEQFPNAEREVQLVVEAPATFSPATLDRLRTLHDELEQHDAVSDVLSMFSATAPPQGQAEPRPLFPDDLGSLDNWDELRQRATDHPLIAGKLLSDDGSLAVVALSLQNKERSLDEERALIGEIRQIADRSLAGENLDTMLTGISVMRVEVIAALAGDQTTFRFLALGIGLVLCLIIFQRVSFVAIAGIPAAVAVTWLLGGMWFAGQEINVLTGMAPVIVVVIVFADCMHLLFSIRDNIARGEGLTGAIDRSVRQVGPACVLTSLTTTLALASLLFVPHPFISRFGITAASGTAVALVATLILAPALSALLLRRYAEKERGNERHDPVRRLLDAICRGASASVAAAPRAIALLGVLAAAGGIWLHSLNEPHYSYASNLPEGDEGLAAVRAIDRKLAGANTVRLFIGWPATHEFQSAETADAIADAHDLLEREQAFDAVTSLQSVADYLSGDAGKAEAASQRLLQQDDAGQPGEGLVSGDHRSAIVTAQLRDITSAELVPILDRVEADLNAVRDQHPEATFTVTGIVAITARAAHEMIQQLNQSLMIAIGLIIVLIAFAMRSFRMGLISILPNLFPIAIGGAYLYLRDEGLQFTSVVAFTVGFGIAVDSTIHMLNQYRLLRSEHGDSGPAVHWTIMVVGPVVIASTLVLAAGIGTSLLSELPLVQLYGEVAVVVLLAALFGDLILLPAALAAIDSSFGKGPTRQGAKREPTPRQNAKKRTKSGILRALGDAAAQPLVGAQRC